MSRKRTPRPVENVLLITKHTAYQQSMDEDADRLKAKLADGDRHALSSLSVDQQHRFTEEVVISELKQRHINYDVKRRDQFEGAIHGYDLGISIGGDGTYLNLARRCTDVPVLGVNSAWPSSLGHFCLATAETFGSIIDSIRGGKLRPHRMVRLMLTRDGQRLPAAVLNEVLVHNQSPAGTTRYEIEIKSIREFQRSSGIWIGTPSGSTAALRSAGGKYIPSTQRQLEYIVREPSFRPDDRFQLLRGVLGEDEPVKITSHTKDAKLFVDGEHVVYDFDIGSELVVSIHPEDLLAFVDPQINKRYSYFHGVYTKW